MVPNSRFCEGITPWQYEFCQAYDSELYRFFVLEWARRHRKTTAAINLLIRECVERSRTISTYVAPYLAQAREIVWDDPEMLFAYLPSQHEIRWEKNESKLHIRFANGSLFRVVGADKIDRRRGLNTHRLVLDEWASMKQSIWDEIFQPIMAGEDPKNPRKTIFCYTPKGTNHATTQFDWVTCQDEIGQTLPTEGVAAKLRLGWWASRIINDATQFLSQEFLEMAQERWPKAVYDQEINCARVTDEELTLITSAMVEALKGYTVVTAEDRHIVSCDPSLGGDLCPILYIKNGRVEDERLLRERNSMIITGEIIAMGTKHKCKHFVVDSTGISVGKAIVDRMAEQGYADVYGFESAGQASDPARFANLKAEAWFYMAEQVHQHNIPYIEDQQTRQDVCSVRYRVSDSRGRLILQPKEETKKLLGRSPDKGDALVMGVWRLKDVGPMGQPVFVGGTDRSNLAESYAWQKTPFD